MVTSGTKAGYDESEEGEKEGRGGGEEWDPDCLVQLVGQQHEEHQQRHHQEAVTQRRVRRGPPVVSVHVRHPAAKISEVEAKNTWSSSRKYLKVLPKIFEKDAAKNIWSNCQK